MSAEFRLAQVEGKYVLVCPLPDKKRCVVLEFLVIHSDFVRNEQIAWIESREEIVEKRRQVNVLMLELEELLQHAQIVLSTINVLMSTNGKFGKIFSQPEDSELLKLSDIWEKTAYKRE